MTPVGLVSWVVGLASFSAWLSSAALTFLRPRLHHATRPAPRPVLTSYTRPSRVRWKDPRFYALSDFADKREKPGAVLGSPLRRETLDIGLSDFEGNCNIDHRAPRAGLREDEAAPDQPPMPIDMPFSSQVDPSRRLGPARETISS